MHQSLSAEFSFKEAAFFGKRTVIYVSSNDLTRVFGSAVCLSVMWFDPPSGPGKQKIFFPYLEDSPAERGYVFHLRNPKVRLKIPFHCESFVTMAQQQADVTLLLIFWLGSVTVF